MFGNMKANKNHICGWIVKRKKNLVTCGVWRRREGLNFYFLLLFITVCMFDCMDFEIHGLGGTVVIKKAFY